MQRGKQSWGSRAESPGWVVAPRGLQDGRGLWGCLYLGYLLRMARVVPALCTDLEGKAI